MNIRVLMLSSMWCAGAWASVKVVTTTPDLAWAVNTIGVARVQVTSLLRGHENPHFVDAVPDFIQKTASAKLVVLVGAELEVGWMPKVLSRSGNGEVQPGGRGYCEVAKHLQLVEKPVGAVDRSMGDVHPMGNPHFWLGPRSFAGAGKVLRDCLMAIDPEGAEVYKKGQADFEKRVLDVLTTQRARLEPFRARLKVPVLLEYHKEFSYFLENYGLKSWGSLEEKPGVPPSAGRVAEVALAAKKSALRLLLAAEYNPKNLLKKFTELSGVSSEIVATSLQDPSEAQAYELFQSKLIDAVTKHLRR